MTEYRIVTNPKYPKYDPNLPLWRKILGILRVIQRPRFVVMHQAQQVLWCHPANLKVVTALLDRQGHRYTTGPALHAVDGGKS